MNQQKAEEFVRVWQTSKDAAEVAVKLSMPTANSARSAAVRLREKGVPLKHNNRKNSAPDYGALKELAISLMESK